ncbi:MAG: ABC transporter ATP-binding protein [Candidatus Acidiferrales bacterium]
MVSQHAIRVQNLEKYFPPAHSGWRAFLQPFTRPTLCALAGISFTAARGEAVALIGANGAGKSTLLRVLATLLLPTRGTAEIGGCDVVREGAHARRQLGYHTGGEEGFYGRLTGRENLLLFGTMNNLSAADARQRVAEMRELLDIGDSLDRQVRSYSTGMLQRLSLARALLHGPSVLILDEPTRSLDMVAAADFRRFLKSQILGQRGTTLLFASHVLEEVDELAGRVALLHAGRLLAFDTPRNLCAASGKEDLRSAIEHLTPRTPSLGRIQ